MGLRHARRKENSASGIHPTPSPPAIRIRSAYEAALGGPAACRLVDGGSARPDSGRAAAWSRLSGTLRAGAGTARWRRRRTWRRWPQRPQRPQQAVRGRGASRAGCRALTRKPFRRARRSGSVTSPLPVPGNVLRGYTGDNTNIGRCTLADNHPRRDCRRGSSRSRR